MMPGSKGLSPHELAHKWVKDLMTCILYTSDGTVLGSIIGGQVLPENPDEEKFRQTARELGIDEDKYIKALKKVNVKTKEQIDASANLLGDVINTVSYTHLYHALRL